MYYVKVRYRGKDFYATSGLRKDSARRLRLRLLDEIEACDAKGIDWTPPREVKRQARNKQAKDMPLRKFTETFEEDWLTNKKSADFYKQRIKQINKSLGNIRLSRLTTGQIQKFYDDRVKKTSVGTANADLRALSSILNRAIEWDYPITLNPVKRVQRVRTENRMERFLTHDEASTLLKHCPEWLRGVVIAALMTGCRQSELLTLTWDCVDLPRRSLRLSGSRTKTGKGRDIPINETLHRLLKSLPRPIDKTKPVFTKKGKPISKTILKLGWKAALEASEIDHLRFHDLRHTAASWLVAAGVPLYEVSRILGHSSIRMTERYAHFAPDHLRRATEALDRVGINTGTKDPDCEEQEEEGSNNPC